MTITARLLLIEAVDDGKVEVAVVVAALVVVGVFAVMAGDAQTEPSQIEVPVQGALPPHVQVFLAVHRLLLLQAGLHAGVSL